MSVQEQKPEPLSKTEKDLFRIIVISNFLAFGGLGAMLYSFRPDGDPIFEITLGSFIAFLIAGTASVFFWRMIRTWHARDKLFPADRFRWVQPALIVVALILTGLGLSGWLNDFWSGALAAFGLVSGMAYIFIQLVQKWGLK